MAIKFEDKAPESGKAKKTTEARFATPIAASDPVNPDASSADAFADPPKAERKNKPRMKK